MLPKPLPPSWTMPTAIVPFFAFVLAALTGKSLGEIVWICLIAGSHISGPPKTATL